MPDRQSTGRRTVWIDPAVYLWNRSLADNLKPVDAKGRWKPSPLLLLISLIVCALAGVFFYFTLGGRR